MTAVDPLLNAASWTLAANLTRAHPDFQIRETHPGGGLYDCLTIVDDRRTVWINRAGSIRIEPPRDAAEQVLAAETWQAAVKHHAGQRRLACHPSTVLGQLWRLPIVSTACSHPRSSAGPRQTAGRLITRISRCP